MCYHGLGHGVLAYADYDLKRAVALCQKAGTAHYGYEEGNQCVGGVIMEIISGGGHNHDLWEKQRVQWLKPEDPLYPCKADFMPEGAKTFCYLYITPYLWIAAGGDIGTTDSAVFEKAFRFCDGLPKNDARGRDVCYGGFGKEFIVLAQERDIRKMSEMTRPQFERVYSWCLLAKNKEGSAACLANAVYSLYWGGENAPDAAIRFCTPIPDTYLRGSCMVSIIRSVASYQKDPVYRDGFCRQLLPEYAKLCVSSLQ